MIKNNCLQILFFTFCFDIVYCIAGDNDAFCEQLSGDIHEEVDSHNRMLDRMVCI